MACLDVSVRRCACDASRRGDIYSRIAHLRRQHPCEGLFKLIHAGRRRLLRSLFRALPPAAAVGAPRRLAFLGGHVGAGFGVRALAGQHLADDVEVRVGVGACAGGGGGARDKGGGAMDKGAYTDEIGAR